MWSDPAFLIAAAISVILVGLAKGGFAGLGALATPVLALAIGPVEAAAILLPILIVQDAVSLWSFRGRWHWWIIGWMLPGAIVGIAIGYGLAARLPTDAIVLALGMITAGFGFWRIWLEVAAHLRATVVAPSTSPGWVGSLFGVATGFTSQLAHAGGPPFQMWVAPRQLPHIEYVATNVLLFAVLNLVKLPTYVALGMMTVHVLSTAALLMPLAIASTLAGVWLVRRLATAGFYRFVYVLMVLLGTKLIWDGAHALGWL